MPSIDVPQQAFNITNVSFGDLTVSSLNGSKTSNLYAGLIGYAVGPGGIPASQKFVISSVVSPGVIRCLAAHFSNTGSSGVPFNFSAYNTGAIYLEEQLAQVASLTSSSGLATALETTENPVVVNTSAPPTANQVLKAVTPTEAAWEDEAGGATPTGTGWIHVTAGVQDVVASTPTFNQVGADQSGAASGVQSNLTTHSNLTIDAHGGIAPNYLMSTGLVSGGVLSVNVDPAKFNLSAGTADIINTYTTPTVPVVTRVLWNDFVGVTDIYLATSDVTYIGINAAAQIVQSTSFFSPDQLRDIVFIGVNGHPTRISISNSASYPNIAYSPGNTLADFLNAFGQFCITGNVYYPAGGMYLAKSAGATFSLGQNYSYSRKSPNILPDEAQPAPGDVIIIYAKRNGAGGWTNSAPGVTIDGNHYDNGTGTLASVPSGQYTIQHLFFFSGHETSFTGITYGQATYATIALAKAALQDGTEPDPATDVALFRAWLVVQQGQTVLTQENFVAAGKFGMSSTMSTGVGGETNTASNLGTAGVGLYAQKSGVDLQFKSIKASSSKITVTDSPSDNTVALDVSLTTADVADSTDKRYCTDAQKTVISNTSGSNTGDKTLADLGGVPTTRTVNGYALSANVTISATESLVAGTNLGDASVTINPGTDVASFYTMPAATMTTNRVVTLGVTGTLVAGLSTVWIMRRDATAYTLTIRNGGTNGTLIADVVLPANPAHATLVGATYDGVDWIPHTSIFSV